MEADDGAADDESTPQVISQQTFFGGDEFDLEQVRKDSVSSCSIYVFFWQDRQDLSCQTELSSMSLLYMPITIAFCLGTLLSTLRQMLQMCLM